MIDRLSVPALAIAALALAAPAAAKERPASGEAELAIAASIGDAWDRLDTWQLFDEPFDMVFSRSHRLANHEHILLDDLRPERFLLRSHPFRHHRCIRHLHLMQHSPLRCRRQNHLEQEYSPHRPELLQTLRHFRHLQMPVPLPELSYLRRHS